MRRGPAERTEMSLLTVVLVTGVCAAVAAFLVVLFRQIETLRRQSAETGRAQTDALTQHLLKMTSEVNRQLEAVGQRVMESQKSVGDRLDSATRAVGDVHKGLGALSQASERILEVGKDIAGLQNILKAPKLRGGLGEFLLTDLLTQILPPQHVMFQYSFKTRETVDAVIRLGGRLAPVDAKFPLENFRKMMDAGNDDERRGLRKKFAQDMRKHVDAVASKYILPDEGTFDFALLYIPAENVYYECIVKDDEDGALMEYALSRRVVPVSPGSFYAYLQVIALGLRGFQIEENARRIMEDLARLRGDMERFADEFDLLGRHLSNAKTKHDDADRRLQRVQDKLSTIADTAPAPSLIQSDFADTHKQ
ncbi:MAG: DNA recombination protein RmuC [Elusimicrobia bacterium]|nr:DNA recombination protein RmuC [Elusimicrobiota bacterium]